MNDLNVASDFEAKFATEEAYHPFAADTGQDASKLRMRRRQRSASVDVLCNLGDPIFLLMLCME